MPLPDALCQRMEGMDTGVDMVFLVPTSTYWMLHGSRSSFFGLRRLGGELRQEMR